MDINQDTWYKAMAHTSQKKVFWWGAGKRFSIFLDFIEKWRVSVVPDNIIDNDINKRYIQKKIMGEEKSIIPWSEMRVDESETVFIIITILHYQEVINQIREKCKNKKLYILTAEYVMETARKLEIENKSLLFPMKRAKQLTIPKILHYCWFGGKPMPEKNKKYIESWKRHCPDYEIREWNENNYDVSKCLYMKQAWEYKYWAFVSDYARLDIIYENGGIYLDTDVEVLRNLDDLLYQEAYLGFESNLYVATGLGFGAKKNHPIIKELRDDYDSRVFKQEDGTFNLLGCPSYQTNRLKKHGLITNGQHQQIGNVTVYPASVLCSCSYPGKEVIVTPFSYTIHHYDASWLVK